MKKDHISSRQIKTYLPNDIASLQKKARYWAATFPLCTVLDSNHYQKDKHHRYDQLIAVGKSPVLKTRAGDASFDQLKKWHLENEDWLFGYFSYDLKNEMEDLSSKNKNAFQWPDMLFFQPLVILAFNGNELNIHSLSEKPDDLYQEIERVKIPQNLTPISTPDIKSGMSKSYYLESVEAIRQHIIEGDIYEMNFCQEFYAEDYDVDPLSLFSKLNDIAKAPFATFFRWKNAYLCCASPERFIQKRENQIISQPIKGTIKRGTTQQEDVLLQQYLHVSEKDRAENVMIVDLVRNDFARSCQPGSVKVDELFAIYPFEQVSHMISTISGTLRNEVHFTEAIQNAFPMGSMTGAPKVMSMKLIEQYEKCKRGLYSGAVGYISPEGDFDFNVVIRSILYDTAKRYLSFQVGGAIVYDSEPEKEYEECLLKAKGMLKVLGIEHLK